MARGDAPGRSEKWWAQRHPLSPLFARDAMARFNADQERFKSSRAHERVQRSWRKYYSRAEDGHVDTTEINLSGKRGENLDVATKRFNRVIRDMIALVVQTPPDYEPVSLNTDASAQAQALLVKAILRWYHLTAHLPKLRVDMARLALLALEAFMHIRWNPQGGQRIKKVDGKLTVAEGPEAYAVDGKGVEHYQGDLVFSVRSRYEVAYDRTSPDRDRPRWIIVKEPENRYDVLADLAEDFKTRKDGKDLKRAILDAPEWTSAISDLGYEDETAGQYDDCIPVYYVYVERCSALPEGLKARVLNDQFSLSGGPLNEDRAGVIALTEERVMMRGDGHSSMHDGLALDQVHGAMFSTALTNQDALGLAKLLYARESNIKRQEVGGGVVGIKYDHFDAKRNVPIPPPQILQQPEARGVLEVAAMAAAEIDTAMGGSAVQRGDPNATKGDSGSKVAAMLAAVQTVSSQFLLSVLDVDSEVATFIISSLRRHATVERIVMLTGSSQQYVAETFRGEDLNQIPRVLVRRPNPARDTFQGRYQMAELWLQAKTDQEREAVRALVVTGNDDVFLEEPEMMRLHLKRENEALMDPTQPVPKTDPGEDHLEHYRSHRDAACNPAVRKSPELMARNLQHRQEHIDRLTMGHPNYAGDQNLMATGQRPMGHLDETGQFMPNNPPGTPPKSPGGAPAQPPQPGQPPGGPPGSGGPGVGRPAPAATGPQQAQSPRMPEMPRGPEGERAERPAGMETPAGMP